MTSIDPWIHKPCLFTRLSVAYRRLVRSTLVSIVSGVAIESVKQPVFVMMYELKFGGGRGQMHAR